MPFLSIILAAEIIFAGITLNINIGNTKNNILGVQLAQTDSGNDNTQSAPPADSSSGGNQPAAEQPSQNSQPSTDNSSNNNPAAQPQPSSIPAATANQDNTGSNQSQPSSKDTSQTSQTSQTDQPSAGTQNSSQGVINPLSTTNDSSANSSPYDAAANNTDSPVYFNDIINTGNQPEVTLTPQSQSSESKQNPSETPTETTIVPSVSGSISMEAEPSPTTPESFPNQTAAVLDQNDLLNTPENINKQSIDEVKKEEDQMYQTADPEEQTKLLINFASDKVKDINNFIKTDDFASTNFASQRLNAQIDKASENLANLTPAKARQLQKQLANFCQQADYVLKTAELSVPEEGEQDLEISRAKCMDISQ